MTEVEMELDNDYGYFEIYRCPECSTVVRVDFNYCPNCGAKAVER